jgi:hypothetical protein
MYCPPGIVLAALLLVGAALGAAEAEVDAGAGAEVDAGADAEVDAGADDELDAEAEAEAAARICAGPASPPDDRSTGRAATVTATAPSAANAVTSPRRLRRGVW